MLQSGLLTNGIKGSQAYPVTVDSGKLSDHKSSDVLQQANPNKSSLTRPTKPADELLTSEIARLNPAEIIFCEDQALPLDASRRQQAHSMPPWYFDLETTTRLLCEQYKTRDLQGFGIADQGLAICAAGCLLQYVNDTLKTQVTHLQAIRSERVGDVLLIDANSR